eukprot:TRINITY_DN46179_c0_g1_i1.p1 TRINITY_DN46179_c0_g1~~TRINITY_DN46179_c0_g1_i1.p1  ORF type:complete len:762 (+),score=123.49 TRINITY_DN46179_c0_g1_i1:194-2287(+)
MAAEDDAASSEATPAQKGLRRRASFLPGQENSNDVWNQLFKDKAKLRDPLAWENFWTEIKDRLLRRHGNMYAALRKLNSEYGVSIDFSEFCGMMQKNQIMLEPRICRAIYEKAVQSEKVLSLLALKHLLLGRAIRKMQEQMRECNNRQARIHMRVGTFLKTLVLKDPVSADRAVERFKRKLTIEFCRDFWQCMLAQLPKPSGPSSPVDLATFERILRKSKKVEDGGLQPYEIVFMMRVFYRIRRIHDSVFVCDIVAIMLMVCLDTDCCKKVKLLFEVFDVDYDGCLLWDQLLQLFCCLCRQRPVAEESAVAVSDIAFQQDLSAQEGLHAYECTRWHIQRGTNLEGDIVTLRELWVAFSKQTDLMASIFPSAVNIAAWILERTPEEPPDECDSAANAGLGTSAPSAGLASAPRGAGQGGIAANATMAANKGTARPQATSASLAQEEVGVGSKMARRNVAPFPELRLDDEYGADASFFRNTRTQGFQQSLRGFGVKRLNELQLGFMLYDDPELALAASTGGLDALDGFAFMSPSVGSSPGGKLDLPGSPAHLQATPHGGGAVSGNASLSRTASSRGRFTPHGSRSTRGFGSPKDAAGGLSRMGSSPALLGQSSSATTHSHGGTGHGHWNRSNFLEGVPVIAPSIIAQRLGSEAADRFRLFAAVKGGQGNQRLGVGSDKGIQYSCQLCERNHTFLQECGR